MRKLKKGIIFVFLLIALPLCLSRILRAEEAAGGSPAAAEPKEKIEVKPWLVEKKLPSYSLTLKQLVEIAEKNVKALEALEEREVEARQHFEKADELYRMGRLKEAKEEWKKVASLSRSPEVRQYMENLDRAARQEIQIRSKKEEEALRELETEMKEEAAAEQREEEKKRKEALLKQAEAKKAQRLEDEKKRKDEERASRLEEERLRRQEKEKQLAQERAKRQEDSKLPEVEKTEKKENIENLKLPELPLPLKPAH